MVATFLCKNQCRLKPKHPLLHSREDMVEVGNKHLVHLKRVGIPQAEQCQMSTCPQRSQCQTWPQAINTPQYHCQGKHTHTKPYHLRGIRRPLMKNQHHHQCDEQIAHDDPLKSHQSTTGVFLSIEKRIQKRFIHLLSDNLLQPFVLFIPLDSTAYTLLQFHLGMIA